MENSLSRVVDIVILGSGPAGYTAALYAARANLQPLLIAGPQPGGQLTITTEVENYPGFVEPILGPELMERFRDQAARFGTEMVQALVERVDFAARPFAIVADNGASYRARSVIVATGASARLLGIPSEQKFMGFGVSACATCDGFFFRGKRVMVVGGGDTAMEEASYLTRFCTEVVVVHRRDALRASKIMQERAFKNPKIRFAWDSEIAEVLGQDEPRKVTGAKLRDLKTGAVTEQAIDGIFIAIGHRPNTKFLEGQLPTDERGYVLVEPGTTRTRVPGVFAAGDVADPTYRQAVTAAGTGCMAAIEAERWLEAQPHQEETPAAPGAPVVKPA
ncbi:MAG: thioredoxin-disulfide reductase [Candidatus Eisenbacteria bacterium]|nr:thioredoxin-disulfide reductase [Candidatus Eisenbacteria bacterium]